MKCHHPSPHIYLDIITAQCYSGLVSETGKGDKTGMGNTLTTVYAMKAGTPYSLETVESLSAHLGSSKSSAFEVAGQYKALGFSVTGLPASDCAKAVLVLYTAAFPPKVKDLA